MGNLENIYQVEQNHSAKELTFYFISKGKSDRVKVIQYTFIRVLNKRKVYNLGFGDYDLVNDTIADDINSNNGDVYKVLNTVLSTIPGFFKEHRDAMLMVQGSDSRNEFLESCRPACTKRCKDGECKNFNRRISLYRGYVDKNFELLNKEYQFIGGKKKHQ